MTNKVSVAVRTAALPVHTEPIPSILSQFFTAAIFLAVSIQVNSTSGKSRSNSPVYSEWQRHPSQS